VPYNAFFRSIILSKPIYHLDIYLDFKALKKRKISTFCIIVSLSVLRIRISKSDPTFNSADPDPANPDGSIASTKGVKQYVLDLYNFLTILLP